MRLYHQLRSAHLERAAQLAHATIVYRGERYDFDQTLTTGLDLRRLRGWQVLTWFGSHRIDTLEINEPLMWPAARTTLTALVGCGLSRRLSGHRPRVVCYAIENRDPELDTPRGPRARAHHLFRRWAARRIWKRVDRIAYGTPAAADLYATALPARPATASTSILALPARYAGEPAVKRAGSVAFVGALTERKGVPALTSAWSDVVRRRPEARLAIVGKGRLEPQVRQFGVDEPSVEVTIDPPRIRIHEVLARTQVLVLPSQPAPHWREQIGLPVLEGLSHGCTIVTTTETGLAGWLREHGHPVVAAADGAPALAAALVQALDSPVPPTDVLACLPDRDGRLAADDWLFS